MMRPMNCRQRSLPSAPKARRTDCAAPGCRASGQGEEAGQRAVLSLVPTPAASLEMLAANCAKDRWPTLVLSWVRVGEGRVSMGTREVAPRLQARRELRYEFHTCVCTCVPVCAHTLKSISSLCLPQRPPSENNHVARSSLCPDWFPNRWKGNRAFFGELADSRSEAENAHSEAGTSRHVRKQRSHQSPQVSREKD